MGVYINMQLEQTCSSLVDGCLTYIIRTLLFARTVKLKKIFQLIIDIDVHGLFLIGLVPYTSLSIIGRYENTTNHLPYVWCSDCGRACEIILHSTDEVEDVKDESIYHHQYYARMYDASSSSGAEHVIYIYYKCKHCGK
jgi:hypothetical protein